MNEKMEAGLTKMDSRPDDSALSEDESVDEAVPIDIRKERKTKAYKETMIQDINNIETYETITTTKWRRIYEVIDEAYIKDSNIPFEDFIRKLKKI